MHRHVCAGKREGAHERCHDDQTTEGVSALDSNRPLPRLHIHS